VFSVFTGGHGFRPGLRSRAGRPGIRGLGMARALGMIPSRVTTVNVGAAAARVHRGNCTACQPECAPASLSDHFSDQSDDHVSPAPAAADIEHPTRQELEVREAQLPAAEGLRVSIWKTGTLVGMNS
jgi:hypothetical protein